MKCVTRNLFLFLIILFPTILFGQDVPNAGFENWTGNVPDDWFPNDSIRVFKSDSAHGGSHSVQLQILKDEFNILYGGKIDVGSDGTGFDYFQRPDYLTGYYMLDAQIGDHLWVDVWFYKDGGTTLIGHGQATFAQPTSGWTEFSTQIFYTLSDFPDRCNIQLFIGLGGTQEDSGRVWVDDVHFQFASAVEEIEGNIPNHFELMQNYPNPFNPNTRIQFELPQRSFVKLEVFNSLGEMIETLISEELSSGTYGYDWNANELPSGVYFYTLIAENFISTKKLILLK